MTSHPNRNIRCVYDQYLSNMRSTTALLTKQKYVTDFCLHNLVCKKCECQIGDEVEFVLYNRQHDVIIHEEKHKNKVDIFFSLFIDRPFCKLFIGIMGWAKGYGPTSFQVLSPNQICFDFKCDRWTSFDGGWCAQKKVYTRIHKRWCVFIYIWLLSLLKTTLLHGVGKTFSVCHWKNSSHTSVPFIMSG